jgi:hypothetical protein
MVNYGNIRPYLLNVRRLIYFTKKNISDPLIKHIASLEREILRESRIIFKSKTNIGNVIITQHRGPLNLYILT